jgi:heat shock protein beta
MPRREPKDVPDEEYEEFYKAVSKDPTAETLGWAHFKVGIQLVVPRWRVLTHAGRHRLRRVIPRNHVQKITSGVNNVRLMVKRVFITDDLGEEYMPRWLSFLKVTVDADDLP